MSSPATHVVSTSLKQDETYYSLLKVPVDATVAEIVSAYHTAKGAFSKDSVATYSLFSTDEIKEVLAKLDEAYHHLSNVERRREYDRYLAARANGVDMPFQPEPPTPIVRATPLPHAASEESLGEYTIFTGATLKEIRERRSLTLDEVARITKIPSKFLKAIENEDKPNIPARVYLQGFVKNLSVLYKLDPKVVTKSYLEHLDTLV